MASNRISLKRTVYYDSETGDFCQCKGDFWKTCSLRTANDLSCQEAILSITPIERDKNKGAASEVVRAVDEAFRDLKDGYDFRP
jgi:hypothetical protein